MRIEVYYNNYTLDGRAKKVFSSLKSFNLSSIREIAIIDVYLTDYIDLNLKQAQEIFCDPVVQKVLVDKYTADYNPPLQWNYLLEITYKAGVTDPVAITAKSAIKSSRNNRLSEDCVVQTAVQYLIKAGDLSEEEILRLKKILGNPLIQQTVFISKKDWEQGVRPPSLYSHAVAPSSVTVEAFDIHKMTDEDLNTLSKERVLALTLQEMSALRDYFKKSDTEKERLRCSLPRGITDIELEMIAQTWSEHCKHKILNSYITYTEGSYRENINSLFSEYIKQTTKELWKKKSYLKSVFHDNSGVIQFDDNNLICFKVETHNSPSALDPYGGAITGIVGVNRDILGTGKGAKPIFNTNVLCFGKLNTPKENLLKGFLSPHQVMSGVHKGIIDGGNQSGIPTAGGAFIFDNSYIGKPLVFCGTGGILPAEISGEEGWINHVDPGDIAVMLGGRIGKDGIHGATFSSLTLDDESPCSAVQIGDPITQKNMSDFLIEARDRCCYKGITDNGAGGLSSSLGEMAELSGGVKVYLDLCPLKYQGLAPWEILVSESQERMSLAVSPEKIDAFITLAAEREVEAAVIGEFTDSGYIEIFFKKRLSGKLPLHFLHHGLPVMHLKAKWDKRSLPEITLKKKRDLKQDLIKLLSDPNIASKEPLVRQYDHEVQAQSVIKPFVGIKSDAPSDGAVLKPVPGSFRGITITHGICPGYGSIDTYHMAMCAVDEAFRSHIGCGGHPDITSALDNFCWPDPVQSSHTPDGEYKLAQLVRACKGLKDACLNYGIPLISGKDSMKNDAVADNRKISVKPTLLISLMGIIEDLRKAVTTDFKKENAVIFILGNTRGELGGTAFETVLNIDCGKCPEVKPDEAFILYKRLHQCINKELISSCHDLSDGGFGVALAESALGGRLGAKINLDCIPAADCKNREPARILFCETPSRFIVSVLQENKETFKRIMNNLPVKEIGSVTREKNLKISQNQNIILDIKIDEIETAWKSCFEGWRPFYG